MGPSPIESLEYSDPERIGSSGFVLGRSGDGEEGGGFRLRRERFAPLLVFRLGAERGASEEGMGWG